VVIISVDEFIVIILSCRGVGGCVCLFVPNRLGGRVPFIPATEGLACRLVARPGGDLGVLGVRDASYFLHPVRCAPFWRFFVN
jgi:hypothetical protein